MGFPMSKNTWEPFDNLTNCKESIEEFEISQAQLIIGIKKMESKCAVKFNHGEIQMIALDEVKAKWPKLLQSFLMERLQFTIDNYVDHCNGVVESKNVVFIDQNKLIRIIGKFVKNVFRFHGLFIHF